MLAILFAIFNVVNSKTTKNSQDFTLVIRILIDLSFFIMILIIRAIITFSNSNNSHKLFKNNNVRYKKLVDLYKSSAETQTSFLSRIKINLVNRT